MFNFNEFNKKFLLKNDESSKNIEQTTRKLT